jgi:DNA-binding response OmpR family regulator
VAGEAAALRGRRVLIVEDDYLLAQFLTDVLEEADVKVVGPIGWIDEALALVENSGGGLDGAILDVNLHGRNSYPVAEALAARAIPFLFATGYGQDALDGQYRNHLRCEKPFDQDALIALLGELLSKSSPGAG